jgi:hypothetical protein
MSDLLDALDNDPQVTVSQSGSWLDAEPEGWL